MRRLRYGVAMSLDGYIAGPKGEADWIVMDPEIDFAAIWSEHDTLLMGRRTYDGMRAMGAAAPETPGMKIVVVSRTLVPREHPKVTIVSGNLEETVAALKKEPGKDIWLFGGGELFRSLVALGLVDTVEVAVIPVLLGEGIPLLPAPAAKAKLTLAKHRIYAKTGIVWLAYDVAGARVRKRR